MPQATVGLSKVGTEVRDIIAEVLNRSASEIRPELKFVEDLKGDSFNAIEVAMDIEDQLEIEIEDESIYLLTTVQDIIDHVERVVAAK